MPPGDPAICSDVNTRPGSARRQHRPDASPDRRAAPRLTYSLAASVPGAVPLRRFRGEVGEPGVTRAERNVIQELIKYGSGCATAPSTLAAKTPDLVCLRRKVSWGAGAPDSARCSPT